MNDFVQTCSDVLLRQFETIVMEFAGACADARGDLAVVETAVDLAIGSTRGLFLNVGVQAAVDRNRRTRTCPDCKQTLHAWNSKLRRVVTAEGEVTTGAIYGLKTAEARARDEDPLAASPKLHGFEDWRKGGRAFLSVDGAFVRSPVMGPKGLEWFECRAGVIAPLEGERAEYKAYVAGVCDPDAIFDLLAATWRRGRLDQATLHCKAVRLRDEMVASGCGRDALSPSCAPKRGVT